MSLDTEERGKYFVAHLPMEYYSTWMGLILFHQQETNFQPDLKWNCLLEPIPTLTPPQSTLLHTFPTWTNTLRRKHTHQPRASPQWVEWHMTSIRCQLLSEACLQSWLCRSTCSAPAVGLLYMAGISPTSCVPLPHCPFMWLQEEKALTEKKSFVAGAVMQYVWLHSWMSLHKRWMQQGPFWAKWEALL